MKKSILLVFALLMLSVTGLVQLLGHLDSKKNKSTILKQSVKEILHSEAECKAFFSENVEVSLLLVASGRTQYPEINARLLSAQLQIIPINLVATYHWASKDIEGSAGKNPDGTDIVQIYVPALMDLFRALECSGRPDWREVFESHLIVLFLHEMEHVRFKKPLEAHIDIQEESRAWAETCKYTIHPLAQKGIPLLPNDEVIYGAWRESAGNVNDPRWIDAIRHLYGHIDGKVQPETTRK